MLMLPLRGRACTPVDDATVRPHDLDRKAGRLEYGQNLLKLDRGLAAFEFDNEAQADAAGGSKLVLPQPQSLAFIPAECSDFEHKHFLSRSGKQGPRRRLPATYIPIGKFTTVSS